MKKSIIIATCFMILLSCSNKTKITQSKYKCPNIYNSNLRMWVCIKPDEMPEEPIGMNGFGRYIYQQIAHAINDETPRCVDCEYVVDRDGKLIDIQISKKMPKDYTLLEKETIKGISSSPRWKPGTCGGKNIPVKMSFRLSF